MSRNSTPSWVCKCDLVTIDGSSSLLAVSHFFCTVGCKSFLCTVSCVILLCTNTVTFFVTTAIAKNSIIILYEYTIKFKLVLEHVDDIDGAVHGAREARAEAAATVQPVHACDGAQVARNAESLGQPTFLPNLSMPEQEFFYLFPSTKVLRAESHNVLGSTHLVYEGLLLSTRQNKPVLTLKGKEVSSWGAGVVLAPGLLCPAPRRVARTLLHCKLSHLHTHI